MEISASEALGKAAMTMDQRAKEYDCEDGERSMSKIVLAFNAITDRDLDVSEGYLFMLVLKQVRMFNMKKFHEDSALDAIAYASLMAEVRSQEYF